MAGTDKGSAFRLGDVPALERAAGNGQLLILAGAGISRLGPSFLPDWYGLNRAILEEAKACTLRGLPHLGKEATIAVNGLAIEQVPVEAFSDLVVRLFASEGYFEVLDVLDADQANANHHALAMLARQGILPTIVTTNFDTLIERAFREAGAPLDVVTAQELDAGGIDSPAGATRLYKVHGSVTATDTLVDTVSQKLRGLPEALRARLTQLYRTNHVVVIGHSGADLRFGKDYLALSAIDRESPGLTWVVQPGSTASDEVLVEVDRIGQRASVAVVSLPALFGALGVRLAVASESEEEARAEAEDRTARRVRHFFDQPYVGPLSSAAFCASLLARVGQRGAAAVVRNALATEAKGWGDSVPNNAGTVFRGIAVGLMAEGDVAGARRWAEMEVAFWHAVEGYLGAAAPDALAEWQRNMAAARMNLAVVHRAEGSLDEARAALEPAIALADAAFHPGLNALIYQEAAALAWQLDDDLDHVIELRRRAVSAAVDDGNAEQLANALIELANVLLRIGEYDLAWSEVERASQQLRFVVEADLRERVDLVRAEIDARRGSASAALKRLEPLVARHAPDTQPGARVRARLVRLIGSREAHRAQALSLLDEVLVAMTAGRLPERGLSHVPERAELENLRAVVSKGGPDPFVALISVPGRDKEALLRGQIVVAELTQFRPVLPLLFEQLCHMKREQGRWLRIFDVAQGLYRAASRVGDAQRVNAAGNFFSAAWAVGGHVDRALAEINRMLPTAPPGEQRDAMVSNLAALRQGAWTADTLLTPRVQSPLEESDARIWERALAFLVANDVESGLVVLVEAHEAAQRRQSQTPPPASTAS